MLNRFSHDVSVFITSTNTTDTNTPVGFLALDNAYPVDGGVSGLGLRDFSGDGRSDVLQLHRDTAEFSVWLTAPNDSLGEAVFYAITNGFQPSGQIAVDVNGGGLADMIPANLSGSISVRLGEPGGTFGSEQTFSFSGDANGRLITVVAADFDQDGDVDLIGASFAGSFVVENRGDLFTTPDLRGVTYNGSGTFGSMVQVVDQNNDGDPDLVLGSPGGYSLWLGGPGVTFVNQPIDNRGNDPNITGSTLAAGEHLIVFADARPDQGIYHAPFALNQAGEQLILTGSTASGARYLIDAMTFGPLGTDTALARLGCGGPWVTGPPTPRLGNVAGIWRGLVISNEFLLAFPTRAGATYRVEQADAVDAAEWTPLPPMRSLGLELTVRQPLGPARFYRVREE